MNFSQVTDSVFRILLFSFVLFYSCKTVPTQEQMFTNRPKERNWNKWIKRREMKNKTAYNPYLQKKASEKPSAQLQSEGKKALKEARRVVRREKRKLRRTKGAYK